ncbi:hypothetical protein M422DRAFT_46231 [Sphaerobolus stellatus SS14]|uniref:Uncharacterized protein n=1 Tax=Sphaerobolus stellatus (strain SS14) TaxID=990650 RepID=A0A0C9UTH6_SPHS4|nr:hypothetical protein M422DRAFT_46231 [Sphaerobolus stellatus SS14]
MGHSTTNAFKYCKKTQSQSQVSQTCWLHEDDGHETCVGTDCNKENVDPRVHLLTNKVRKLTHMLKNQEKELKVTSQHEARKEWAVAKVLAANHAKDVPALKKGGVIIDGTRALIQDLLADGVTPGHFLPVIKQVTGAHGIEIKGSITRWTISQIGLEGLVADDLQVAEAVKRAEGITYSGDGTTIHGLTHESCTLNVMQKDGSHLCLSLGIHTAINHTVETQVSGLQSQMANICKTYNSSIDARETTNISLKINRCNY